MSQPTSRPTTIYLVRHGESQLNLEKHVSGQLDTPLSPEGHRLSRVLAEQLCDVRFTGIYTSALRRTVETARPTATVHGLTIQNHAAFNEQHFGVLEGRFRDERDAEAEALWKARKQDKRFHRIPGGERFIDLAERVKDALRDILAHEVGGTILIVGHRNTNRALFGMLMCVPEEEWPHVSLKSQSVYRIGTGSHPQLTSIALRGTQTELMSTAL
ncbi:MAG: histidine phosphatase family protein [Nitrospira sp.]